MLYNIIYFRIFYIFLLCHMIVWSITVIYNYFVIGIILLLYFMTCVTIIYDITSHSLSKSKNKEKK